MTLGEWTVVGLAGLAGVCVLVVLPPLLVLHLRSRAAGVPVAMIELIGMHLRRVSPRRVVNARIWSRKHGLDLPITSLETHLLAGGDLEAVVNALIEAPGRGITLKWNEAAAYDLGGGDVLAAVRAGVHPRVGVVDNLPRKVR